MPVPMQPCSGLSDWLVRPWQLDHSKQRLLSNFLSGLLARDLASFCQTCSGALHIICTVWKELLTQRELRTCIGSRPACFLRLLDENDHDEELTTASINYHLSVKQGHPLYYLAQWEVIEASRPADLKVAWGLAPGEGFLTNFMAIFDANLGTQELQSMELALLKSQAIQSAQPSTRSWALLLLYTTSPDMRIIALHELQFHMTHHRETGGGDFSEERWFPYAVMILQLVQADNLQDAMQMFDVLFDLFLCHGDSSSSWLGSRLLPSVVCRSAAFAAAAAMIGHNMLSPRAVNVSTTTSSLDSGWDLPGPGRLLACGSEFLAALLPDTWGRGTSDSEDPLLRQAAKCALLCAENADGGWAGSGAPDVALRCASRKLRVKLGLRLGG